MLFIYDKNITPTRSNTSALLWLIRLILYLQAVALASHGGKTTEIFRNRFKLDLFEKVTHSDSLNEFTDSLPVLPVFCPDIDDPIRKVIQLIIRRLYLHKWNDH